MKFKPCNVKSSQKSLIRFDVVQLTSNLMAAVSSAVKDY